MSEFLQVATTLPAEEAAMQLARSLVERRLAACVQIVGPVTSVYRWQGALETSSEWQCLAKTRQACLDRLLQTIRELHPYELPEIIATPIVDGSGDYLRWIESETQA